MLADDALADAQPEARSLGPGRKKRIEDARQSRARNSRAVVPDPHLDHVEKWGLTAREQPVGRATAEPAPLRGALPRGGDRDHDLPALRERLKRVHEDVQQHLENLIVIDVEVRDLVGPLDPHVHILADRQLVDERERLLEGG